MVNFRSGILGLMLASVAALAAGSAFAADMYRGEPGGYKDAPYYAPVATWTGFYVGVNGGYGWTNDSSGSNTISPAGGFGGGQIGYNWQGALGHPHLVLGVEADIQGADISASGVAPGDVGILREGDVATLKQSLNWFGTVRGRIGYAMDRTLVYATGGFAYGEVESTLKVNNKTNSTTETQTGYVLGAGIEHKLSPSWSIKGEYQFLSLDASDKNGAGPLGSDKDRTEVHTIRAGLNYHLGNTYEPLK